MEERVRDAQIEFPPGSPELAAALSAIEVLLFQAKADTGAEPPLRTAHEGPERVAAQRTAEAGERRAAAAKHATDPAHEGLRRFRAETGPLLGPPPVAPPDAPASRAAPISPRAAPPVEAVRP